MMKRDDNDQLLQRHEIVMRIMEANSEQLRCDSERCGVEVELLTARGDAEDDELFGAKDETVGALEHRLAELEQQRIENLLELEKLNETLAGFDEVQTNSSAHTVRQ